MSATWGSGSLQLGLDKNGLPEVKSYASYYPREFYAANNGDIYIHDAQNKCIKKFSPNGQYLGQINSSPEFELYPSDDLLRLYIDDASNVYIVKNGPTSSFSSCAKYNSNFSLEFVIRLDSIVNGNLRQVQDNIIILEKNDDNYKLFDNTGKILSLNEVCNEETEITTETTSNGDTVLIDRDGNLISFDWYSLRDFFKKKNPSKTDIMVLLEPLESLYNLGYCNTNVSCWSLLHTIENKSVWYICFFDNSGTLVNIFKARDDTTSFFRKFRVDKHGNVYEMALHQYDGVKIWKYQIH
jgi:hypothetical protein